MLAVMSSIWDVISWNVVQCLQSAKNSTSQLQIGSGICNKQGIMPDHVNGLGKIKPNNYYKYEYK